MKSRTLRIAAVALAGMGLLALAAAACLDALAITARCGGRCDEPSLLTMWITATWFVMASIAAMAGAAAFIAASVFVTWLAHRAAAAETGVFPDPTRSRRIASRLWTIAAVSAAFGLASWGMTWWYGATQDPCWHGCPGSVFDAARSIDARETLGATAGWIGVLLAALLAFPATVHGRAGRRLSVAPARAAPVRA